MRDDRYRKNIKDRTKKDRDIEEGGDGSFLVEGRNAVLELINSGKDVDKLFIAKDASGGISRIRDAALKHGIVVVECDRRKLDQMSETGAHQGVAAVASAVTYVEIGDIINKANEKGEKPLIVICDSITDPHNLGAIIRSAEIAGAHGVIIPKRRSAGVNAACAKAAAGALSYMPIAKVVNTSAAIDQLKDMGVWIFGTDADGEEDFRKADFKGSAAIVIGSEGEGMSRIVKEKCDFLIKIPMKGHITSLNASAAAAVILFEAMKQRDDT